MSLFLGGGRLVGAARGIAAPGAPGAWNGNCPVSALPISRNEAQDRRGFGRLAGENSHGKAKASGSGRKKDYTQAA
jgi:hypothetical protein